MGLITMVAMMTKMTTTKTERYLQGPWLAKRRCPRCKTLGHLLPGRDHPDTRWEITCTECGHRFKIKKPEGFTK